MRQVVLDTETTGLEVRNLHRVVEIGCVELLQRRPSGRHFHCYLNPDREFDAGAQQVTGLTRDFLADKPRFADVVDDFLDFVGDAELIIHNAAFDIGFLDAELARLDPPRPSLTRRCPVLDSLVLARERFPGQRNSLDALCKRLGVDNTHRTLHGALLDAELLAEVYLAMTSGQTDLGLEMASAGAGAGSAGMPVQRPERLRVVMASSEELAAHQAFLQRLREASGAAALWQRAEAATVSQGGVLEGGKNVQAA